MIDMTTRSSKRENPRAPVGGLPLPFRCEFGVIDRGVRICEPLCLIRATRLYRPRSPGQGFYRLRKWSNSLVGRHFGQKAPEAPIHFVTAGVTFCTHRRVVNFLPESEPWHDNPVSEACLLGFPGRTLMRKNKEPGARPGSLLLTDLDPLYYGQLVVNVFGSVAMTTPRAVAPTRTSWPVTERYAAVTGPMIGSRIGIVPTLR